MGRRILVLAAAGWAAIAALTWYMANARIALCGDGESATSANCILRATATRDDITTTALTIALGVAIVAALVHRAQFSRRGVEPRSPGDTGVTSTRLLTALSPQSLCQRLTRSGSFAKLLGATALGASLATAVLWLGGTVRFGPPAWASAPIVEAASPGAFDDLIPASGAPPTLDGDAYAPLGKSEPAATITPIEGDPFADIPMASSTATPAAGPEESDAAAIANEKDK